MTLPPPPDVRPRLRLGLGAAVTLVLVILSAAVGLTLLRGQAAPAQTIADPSAGPIAAAMDVYVHVLGEVRRPGLYVLPGSPRVVDALAAAGGTTTEAELGGVNLARPLVDGEQVVVPAQGAEGAAPAVSDGRVDLNTADAAALETLPGVGPALARRIIAWREENGRFAAVDDLLAVSGIGAKVLAGLRDAVRV